MIDLPDEEFTDALRTLDLGLLGALPVNAQTFSDENFAVFRLSLIPHSCSILSAPCPSSCLSPSICSFCSFPGGKLAVVDSLRVSFGIFLTAWYESVFC